jgi:xanthine dehydrogenase YagR molybdenum-binding subunit
MAILRRAGKEFVEADVKTGAPLEMMKYSMHSYAAQFCEAAVHVHTGEIRIRRWVGAFDPGESSIRRPRCRSFAAASSWVSEWR